MHTPRLCIDGRAAEDFSAQGIIAQELIDQLVAAQNETGIASEWVEKKRTVLLSHPEQVFSGQLKRFNTRKKIGASFFYWAWEKNFVESASISAFHRFRPVDRLEPQHHCPTVTTVLPPRGASLFSSPVAKSSDHHFVVPSNADRDLLTAKYKVASEQTTVLYPSVRRFVHFADPLSPISDGWLLFLIDNSRQTNVKKLRHILSGAFPHLPHKVIHLSNAKELNPTQWQKTLRSTTLCFYLASDPFDWPVIYLEALYLGIPAIFSKANRCLGELLPKSGLELSRYLTELKKANELASEVRKVKSLLEEKNLFDSLHLAKQYRDIYARLESEVQ